MAKADLTAARLRELLHYEPETDTWTRLVNSPGRRRAPNFVGFFDPKGYRSIYVAGHTYLAHRLVWLWCTGEWPTDMIDHIDGNPGNNHISNLRVATRAMNLQNQKRPRKDNTSGYLGVHLKKGRFVARIGVHGKRIQLGSFTTAEQAYAAYLEGKRRLHEGCTI